MHAYTAKERVRRLADRQFGRVGRGQLEWIRVGRGQIAHWVNDGYLIPTLPSVFAVGHHAPSVAGELCAATLYAGPGAMLNGRSAAWWYGLIDERGAEITVSTPRRCRSLANVTVHGRRSTLERVWHRQLPSTTTAQMMLDLAASAEFRTVRLALARLDYHRRLNVTALDAVCGHGKPGSRALRRALARHQPALAHILSDLECDLVVFCERYQIPIPLINPWVHGIMVDAYWPQFRLVVELDGGQNHTTIGQLRLDRSKELTLRSHGILVLRYSWEQIHAEPLLVKRDLLTQIAARA